MNAFLSSSFPHIGTTFLSTESGGVEVSQAFNHRGRRDLDAVAAQFVVLEDGKQREKESETG